MGNKACSRICTQLGRPTDRRDTTWAGLPGYTIRVESPTHDGRPGQFNDIGTSLQTWHSFDVPAASSADGSHTQATSDERLVTLELSPSGSFSSNPQEGDGDEATQVAPVPEASNSTESPEVDEERAATVVATQSENPRRSIDDKIETRIKQIFNLCDPGGTGRITFLGLTAALTKFPDHARFLGVKPPMLRRPSQNGLGSGRRLSLSRQSSSESIDGKRTGKSASDGKLKPKAGHELAAEELFRLMDAKHTGSTKWNEFLDVVSKHGNLDVDNASDSEQEPEHEACPGWSEEDKATLRHIFDLSDVNQKGQMCLQGLLAVCTKTPQHAQFLFGKRRVRWDRVFQEMDEDGSNTISWEEFSDYITRVRAAREMHGEAEWSPGSFAGMGTSPGSFAGLSTSMSPGSFGGLGIRGSIA